MTYYYFLIKWLLNCKRESNIPETEGRLPFGFNL